MHQLNPAAPSRPHPGLLRGICLLCKSRGWGICKFCTARGPGFCQPRGLSRAFDTHAVSYQNVTTQRVLLEKKQIASSVKDRNKLKKGCKGMFSILCMHFFIAYQARIYTQRKPELSLLLLNQISVDIIWRTPFIFIKLFVTYKVTALY